MKKKIKAIVKLALPAGKANPTPPVGPALGQHGINIANFCKEYNSQTQQLIGSIIPAKITIYEDRTYSFILKSPPTSFLLLELLKLKKGSALGKKTIVASITPEDLCGIAKKKLKDLNTKELQKAILIVEGTAKNMGIQIDKNSERL